MTQWRTSRALSHFPDVIDAVTLESGTWYVNPYLLCDDSVEMTFDKGKYMIRGMHVGALSIGEYTITSANVVRLKAYPMELLNYGSIYSDVQQEVRFLIDQKDFWYSAKLVFPKTGAVFYATESKSPPNSEYVLGSYRVMKIPVTTYETTADLKVRELPTQKSQQRALLEKGTSVDVFAIGTSRETINGVESSWYYVNYPTEGDCWQLGWVFGAYVVVKN